MERTLVLVKPDGLLRRLVGQVVLRFEAKGLKIVGMKLMRISDELCRKHYAPHKGKPFYEPLVRFMTSGPVVAMVLEGPFAIDVVRAMMGATFGYKAAPGTIRGDFGVSNQYNLVHGSDSKESAAHEIELFFRPDEILSYALPEDPWLACD